MNTRRLLLTGLILAGGLLIGCVRLPRESLEVNRYSIDLPPQEWSAEKALPIALYIPSFQVTPQQRGDRITYRDSERTMNFYFYHRWVVAPEQMIGDVLSRDLERSGLFGGGVFQGDTGMIPTHEIQGRLVELYADNTRGSYRAIFEVKLTLFRINPKSFDKETIFQKSYPIEVERGDGYVESFVEAVNQGMAEWLNQVHTDLVPLFEEEMRAEPPAERPLPVIEKAPVQRFQATPADTMITLPTKAPPADSLAPVPVEVDTTVTP